MMMIIMMIIIIVITITIIIEFAYNCYNHLSISHCNGDYRKFIGWPDSNNSNNSSSDADRSDYYNYNYIIN